MDDMRWGIDWLPVWSAIVLTILYGNRIRKDILLEDELKEIMEQTEKLRLVSVLSEEEVVGYKHGFVGEDIIRKYMGDKKFSLFASGPQGMYRFLDKEEEKLGLDEKHYRKEILEPGMSHGRNQDTRWMPKIVLFMSQLKCVQGLMR